MCVVRGGIAIGEGGVTIWGWTWAETEGREGREAVAGAGAWRKRGLR